MEFINSNNISISGRIWQKYTDENKDLIKTKGVYFEKSRNFKLSDPQEQLTTTGINVLWRFQAQIKEKMDFSRYPLEVEHIGIEIKPIDKNNNILLVPDLSSYRLLTPTLKPGIDKDAFLPGWLITDSFFSLAMFP